VNRFDLKRLGTLAVAITVLSVVAVPSASAIEAAGLTVRIDVDTSSWAACGVVKDTTTNANYTAVLTATGFESTVAANGAVLDEALASGNPARPCTQGGFNSQYAVVVYTLTWTSVLGTTGTLSRTCAEALGIPVCTPT
jgi:hypothetical protein